MDKWHREETYKGMIALSIEVLRSLILVNGGAAAGLLTFWGSKGAPGELALKLPLLTFAVGVALAVMAALLAYITQNTLYVEETQIAEGKSVVRQHLRFQWITLGLAFASVLAFMMGCTLAANALTG